MWSMLAPAWEGRQAPLNPHPWFATPSPFPGGDGHELTVHHKNFVFMSWVGM